MPDLGQAFLLLVGQVLAIGCNDFLVPVEGILAVAFEGLEVKVVAVNVDEAVAFLDTLVGGNDGLQSLVCH